MFDNEVLLRRLKRVPANIPVLRVFLCYFYDGFNLFSKAYHSTGAGYTTLGGLPTHLQGLLRNILPVHMVPPGVDLMEALRPFFARVKQMEDGCFLNLGPVIGWVFLTGGIGLIRVDMPQGQEFAGCLHQSAHVWCRMCKVHKSDHGEVMNPLAVAKLVRTAKATADIRRGISEQYEDNTTRKEVCAFAGLSLDEGVIRRAGLTFDVHQQMPFEAFHCTKVGNAKHFCNNIMSSLTDDSLVSLNARIRQLDVCHGWTSRLAEVELTTSVARIEKRTVKCNATQAGMLCSALPLLFRNWLHRSRFRKIFADEWAARQPPRDWLAEIRDVVVLVARSNALVLGTHHNTHGDTLGYRQFVHEVVRAGRHACKELWPRHWGTPTMHIGSHVPAMTMDYGGGRSTKNSREECKNHEMRLLVRGVNGQVTPEVQMMRLSNTSHSAKFNGCGGFVHLEEKYRPGPGFVKIVNGPFVSDLLKREAGVTTYVGETSVADEVGLVLTAGPAREDGLDNLGIRVHDLEQLSVLLAGEIRRRGGNAELELARKRVSTGLAEFRQVCQPHRYVDMPGRPRYCRRVRVGRFYTFQRPEASQPSTEIGHVKAVFRVEGVWCVWVSLVIPVDIEDASRLKVMQITDVAKFRVITEVLEPRCLVHLCDEGCNTMGPGFKGEHSNRKVYLENPFILV